MKGRITRREFINLAVLSAAGAALASCAPQATPTAAPQATQAAAKATEVPTQPAKAAPEEVSLTILATNNPEHLVENFKYFTKDHPNFEIKVLAVSWEEFDDKTALLVAGGDPPALWSSMGKFGVTYHASRGLMAPMNPYMDRDGWDWDKVLDVNPDGNTLDGKRYGLVAGVHPTMLVYNKGLFDEAGVEYPPDNYEDTAWTWDECISRLSAVKKDDEDPMKVVWGFGGGIDTRYAGLTFGVNLFNREDYDTHRPTSSRVATDEFKWTLQMLQDLIWKHEIQPSPEAAAELQSAIGASPFVSGKAGAQSTTPNGLMGFADAEIDYGLAPIPINPYDGPRGFMYASPWAMFKHPNQDECWQLLSWCVSEEGQGSALELLKTGMSNLVTRGGWATQKSVAAKWQEGHALGAKRDASTFDLVPKAIPQCMVIYGFVPFAWGEVWDVAMKPAMDQLLMNQISVDEAVSIMEPKINEILAKAE